MLKRQQILLEDWLIGYIRNLSDLYDLSFSEVVRLTLCLEYLDTISKLYPNFKMKHNKQRLLISLKKFHSTEKESEEKHKKISEIYYETRKAIELRLAKEKTLIK